MRNSAFLSVGLALLAAPVSAAPRPVTVADLMALRSIADVRISPDGGQVAYVVSQPSFEKDEHEASLYLVSAAGGPPARLAHGARIFNRPRPVPRLRWTPDGTRLSFLAFASEVPQVFAVDVRGGEARALTSAPQGVGDYAWSPDGSRLAYLAPEPPSAEEEKRRKDKSFVIEVDRQDRPPRLWVQDLSGGAPRALSPPDHFVSALEPYPVQAMASAGMAVLLPMPRGGMGYGEAGLRMIRNGWGEGDYRDIMAGVDHLVKQGLADPDRLGVMGASYGGYMTDWIVTQTDRFKAASAMCSISDLADLYYLSDSGDFTKDYFGLPWEEPEAYARHSAITYVSRVKTPLLIQHGENDRRIPIMQATKFYKALKDQGKIVEMEIYPRGGHVIYEPDLQREIMRRNLEWFKRWLRP